MMPSVRTRRNAVSCRTSEKRRLKLTLFEQFLHRFRAIDDPSESMKWEVLGIFFVILVKSGEFVLFTETVTMAVVMRVVTEGSVDNLKDSQVTKVEHGRRVVRW